MAHITGSGLDNLPRILPSNLKANLKPWSVPSCFLDVKKQAQLSWKDMLQTFNCGLGLILIIKNKKSFMEFFPSEKIITLGKIDNKKEERGLGIWI